jgi:predicted ATPase
MNECLWRDGQRITLPPRPFSVLRYLVEHPGRLVSHDELLDAVWPETYVQPQVLRTYMLDLRRILGDDPRCPRFIQSLPKRGYCFVAPVCDAMQATATSVIDAATPELAGRDRELASLHAHLTQANAGTRQVVFITGESGIGKSALVDVFRRQVEQTQSAAIALGQCIQGFATRQDYYPLLDALGQICGSANAPAACALLHHRADGPAEGGRLSSILLPGDLCAAVEQMAAARPLLLMLEDLQWADESTLNLISALARRHGPASLMILITFAPQTGASSSPAALLHDLHMRHLCREIVLPRLARPGVADLVRARLQQETLPDGLQHFVHQHSEGNPRFALVIVDHLIAEGTIARSAHDNSCWELRAPLDQAQAATPVDIARMIEIEIENLTPREQQIVEAASLAPVAFPSWLVAAALGEEIAEIEDTCNELARRLSFIKRAGEDDLPDGTRSSFYVFAHALYREVLYQRQSPVRRRLRHIRVADRLRRLFPGREELIAVEAATHYRAADDRLNAIAMLQIAARRALELRAYGDAADLHQQIACLQQHLPLSETRTLATDDLRPSDLGSSFDTALPSGPATAKA